MTGLVLFWAACSTGLAVVLHRHLRMLEARRQLGQMHALTRAAEQVHRAMRHFALELNKPETRAAVAAFAKKARESGSSLN